MKHYHDALNILPTHTLPLPTNPALQVHVKLPTVFLHSAFTPQSSIFKTHSSISVKR